MNNIPRRNRLDLCTPIERELYEILNKIERIGAHPKLTDAVIAINEARSCIADYVDNLPKVEE